MAKSVKQQMYEQLANQHVQQALNNIGMQQFQEAYNQWNSEQEGLANFQAAYNAWNDANPVQAAPKPQSIPVLKTPDTTDFFRPKTASGIDVNAEAAKAIGRRRRNEDYARQRQEESALVQASIDNAIDRKYADAVTKGRDLLFGDDARKVSKEASAQRAAEKAAEKKALQEQIEASTFKFTPPTIPSESSNIITPFKIEPQTFNDIVEQTARAAALNAQAPKERKQPELKIDEQSLIDYAEKNNVTVDEARAELLRRVEAANNQQAFDVPGQIDEEATQAQHDAWLEQQRRANQRQQTAYESFLTGMGKAVVDPINGPVMLAGKVAGQDWDLLPDRAREEYNNAKGQHPTASGLGTAAGMMAAAYMLGGGAGTGAGASGTNAAQALQAGYGDALLNGATRSEAVLNGLRAAGGTAATNALKRMPTDIAVDILPTLANDIAEGRPAGEVALRTLGNTAINYGFDLIPDLTALPRAYKGMGRAVAGGADEAVENVARQADNIDFARYADNAVNGYNPEGFTQTLSGELPELDVVERATRQADEAVRNIEELSDAMNKQVADMGVEDAAKNIPSPEELRQLELEANTMDEIDDYSNMFRQPEAPKAEAPEVSAPKTEAPEVKAPEAEAPKVEAPEVPKAQQFESGKYIYDGGVDNPTLSFDQNNKINDYMSTLERPFNNGDVSGAVFKSYEKASEATQKATMDYLEGVDSLYNARKANNPEALQAARDSLKEIKSTLKNLPKEDRAGMKQFMDYWDAQIALDDYKAALNGTDREAVDSAKKAFDAVRNRLARGKNNDSVVKQAFSGNYGRVIGNAAYEYGYQTTDDLDEIIKSFDGPASPAKPMTNGAPGETPQGGYALQTFGGDNGEWAYSKMRTNSAEKTGLIRNPEDVPLDDYLYRRYGAGEQRLDFDARYSDSKDLVRDLVEKDAFDAVDMRGAGNTWRQFMESESVEDLRKANRLLKKMQVEGREGGRLVEAIKEMNRNTPQGQLLEAQDGVSQAIDKRVGKGTSESLDNLFEKISQAFDDAKNKDDFLAKVKELLDGDLKRYATPKTAKDMTSKTIKGAKKIIKMIENADDLSGVPMDDLMKTLYKSNGSVAISPIAQKEIYDLLVEASQYDVDSYEFRLLQARAARKLMAEVPSGLGDYIRSFLYANMLGNFKTAFSRNFFGNVAFQTLEKTRELPTAAADWLTSKVTGKHSALGWNVDKAKAYGSGFKKGSIEQLKDIKNGVDTTRSGQTSWADALRNNATVHNDNTKLGHFANEVDRYVSSALKQGDRGMYEANFAEFKVELEQLLDRYGKNGVAGLENVKDEYIPEAIDAIAQARAADAVFQGKGHISEGLTKMRDGLGSLSKGVFGVDVLSTASSPFTLTPGNMAERAIEYTPLGAVKNGVETAIEVLGGKGFNQRRFVDEAGRTITGLPLLALTYAGAKKGAINGGFSTDPDEKQAQIDDGYIEYGLNVPEGVPLLGGKQLDTSDLPVYGPFMQAGAVMAEEGLTPKASLQAAEAVVGGSATQGLRRAFGADNASYSSQNSLTENLANTVKSSGTQLIPSLMRQTAYATDKYKRDLGEYMTNEYYLNSIKNSIPGLRETLPIKTDVEGEPILQNQGRGIPSRILENYILPMNMSEYTPSPLNEEASRLLDATDKAWAFQPKALRSHLRQWDDKAGIEFSEEQFRDYKQNLGQLNTQMGNALLESDYYNSLDDEAKVAAMQSVYSAMKALAKEDATGLASDDKIVEAYKKNKETGVINYLHGNSIIETAGISKSSNAAKEAMALAEEGKFDEAEKVVNDYAEYKKIEEAYDVQSGSYIKSDSTQAIKDMIAAGDVSGAEELAKQQSELKSYGFSADSGIEKYNKAKAVIPSLTTKEFATTYNDMDTNKKSGISQTEFLDYLNRKRIPLDKAQQYLEAYGGWENKKGQKKKLTGAPGNYSLEY